MIFKRRRKRSFWDAVKDLLQPKKGWRRGFKYIGRRVQRLPDSPHRIALGFACGALASFSPFFTLHAFVAVFYAWLIRGNILAAAFGTIVGNPISFPFIAAASLRMGNWMLGRDDGVETLDQLSFTYVREQPLEFLDLIFTPYLVGGLAPGGICALICYFAIRPVVARFQERRRRILAKRARELVASKRRARDDGGSGGSGPGGGPAGPSATGPRSADAAAAAGLARARSAGDGGASRRSVTFLTSPRRRGRPAIS